MKHINIQLTTPTAAAVRVRGPIHRFAGTPASTRSPATRAEWRGFRVA